MPSRLLFVLLQVWSILLFRRVPARILWSPCPNVFNYQKNYHDSARSSVFPSENDKWRGVLTVRPSLPIHLKIKLLVPALLPSKYVGRIELAEGKAQVVKKIRNGNLHNIKYYIYFPAKIPIPELILVEINSQVVCSQTPIPRRLKTILILEHSLTTVATNLSSREGEKVDNISGIALFKNVKRKETDFNSNCGTDAQKNFTNLYKPSVSSGDWPWMVPLFRKTDLGLRFFCSSTLISSLLLVTAAHCIRFKNLEPIKGDDIVAYVGRFDIFDWTEEHSQPRGISQIFIHPDFNPENFHSDLAVLRLSKPVDASPNVAPACLWEGDEDLSAVVGKKGIVFGWGTDGLGHKMTSTPKLAVMPIVSQEECLRSKMEFLFLTTNRTFCAGFRNGTGPCSGDSGGGLLVPRRYDDGTVRWFLRGVVSLSLVKANKVTCDAHEYSIFTDVAKYQNWIRDPEKKSN